MRKYMAAVAAFGISTGVMGQASQTRAVLRMPPQNADCPVELFAQRHSVEATALAGSQDLAAEEQSLWIGLERRETALPMSATGRMHGMAAGAHAMNVSGAEGGETSELFKLQPTAGDTSLRRAVVALRRLDGVSWVELTEIRFSDGTAWHPSSESRCIAEPGGVVLVDGE